MFSVIGAWKDEDGMQLRYLDTCYGEKDYLDLIESKRFADWKEEVKSGSEVLVWKVYGNRCEGYTLNSFRVCDAGKVSDFHVTALDLQCCSNRITTGIVRLHEYNVNDSKRIFRIYTRKDEFSDLNYVGTLKSFNKCLEWCMTSSPHGFVVLEEGGSRLGSRWAVKAKEGVVFKI